MKNILKFTIMLISVLVLSSSCKEKEDPKNSEAIKECISLLESDTAELISLERNHHMLPDFTTGNYFIRDTTLIPNGRSFFQIKVESPEKDVDGIRIIHLRKTDSDGEREWFKLNKEHSQRVYALMKEKM